MIPVPPAEVPEIKAFTKIIRLTFLKAQHQQVSKTCKQPMYSNMPLVKQNTNNSNQSPNVHPHDQSTVILQQFNMITREL